MHAFRELQALWGRLRTDGGIVLVRAGGGGGGGGNEGAGDILTNQLAQVDDNMPEGVQDADVVRGMFEQSGVRAYADGVKVRGKGRLVYDFMQAQEGCTQVFHGWQMAWVCGAAAS